MAMAKKIKEIGINESNSLRGVERQLSNDSYANVVDLLLGINESNSLRGVESPLLGHPNPLPTLVSMSLIPSGELKEIRNPSLYSDSGRINESNSLRGVESCLPTSLLV